MKILNINREEFRADKIIKTGTDIIGQDLNGNEIFAFIGIPDFTGFTVTNEDGTSSNFDTVPRTNIEILKEENSNLSNIIDSILTEIIPSLMD